MTIYFDETDMLKTGVLEFKRLPPPPAHNSSEVSTESGRSGRCSRFFLDFMLTTVMQPFRRSQQHLARVDLTLPQSRRH